MTPRDRLIIQVIELISENELDRFWASSGGRDPDGDELLVIHEKVYRRMMEVVRVTGIPRDVIYAVIRQSQLDEIGDAGTI